MTTPGKNITIIDTTGLPHEISATTVYTTLAIGWIAFGLAIIFNILYYALHPSKVVWTKIIFVLQALIMCTFQVDLLEIRQKLVVALFGYEINLVECTK